MKASTVLTISFIFILALLSAMAGWFGRMAYDQRNAPPAPPRDTMFVWIRDTIVQVQEKPAGSVIAALPTARPDDGVVPQIDTMMSKPDTVIVRDSVVVEVPIVQRTYEGENYRAVVQGFRPELVSIDIRLPEIAAPTPQRAKRWHFTVGVQLGYGFTPAGWQPYAGIGGTFGYSF